jgi:hypothetical protein
MANHSRRHTGGNGILRDIINDHRTRSNDSTCSNSHSLQDSDAMPDPCTFAHHNSTFAGKRLIHDRLSHHHAMVIAVKGTLRRNLNVAANYDIGNKRMKSASGLNVRTMADMNVST